jgi:predicted metalloprotease with PDZ domain
VHFGSPAWKAGLGFGDKLIAVNGRDYSDDLMSAALRDAKKTRQPIVLIVMRDAIYRTVSISYFDGPRYPHLVRIDGTTDRLSDVVKPLVK